MEEKRNAGYFSTFFVCFLIETSAGISSERARLRVTQDILIYCCMFSTLAGKISVQQQMV